MSICGKCQKTVDDDEIRTFENERLCEDCYLDLAGPKVRSVQYGHDKSDFMRRLKRTFSVIKQEID